MTAQATVLCLSGPNGTAAFLKNNTDDAWGEMVDSINSKSLYQVCKGWAVNALAGYYTAGGAVFRIRNPQKPGVYKYLDALPMLKGTRMEYIERPFRVEDGDIIEVFTTVAGS